MATKQYINPDAGKPAEQLLAERTRRMQDALNLKQPDRIPIQLIMSYMLAEMYGVTRQEQHEDDDREAHNHTESAGSSCRFFLVPGKRLGKKELDQGLIGYITLRTHRLEFVQ